MLRLARKWTKAHIIIIIIIIINNNNILIDKD